MSSGKSRLQEAITAFNFSVFPFRRAAPPAHSVPPTTLNEKLRDDSPAKKSRNYYNYKQIIKNYFWSIGLLDWTV